MSRKKQEISRLYLIESIIMWFITILWIMFIFRMSSENGDDSSKRSEYFLHIINTIFKTEFFTDFLLRKIAHVIEFAILALLAFFSIRFTNLISKKTSYSESRIKIIKSDNELYILLSLWLSTLIAIFDEYHQLFVSNRNGSIIDVGIDLIGIVITLLIIRLVFTFYLLYLGKKEIRYENSTLYNNQ